MADPFYSNVSLLLHCDGTNGSTSFPDNAPTPNTVTANGNAQVSTAQSVFGGASCRMDASLSGYLSVNGASGVGPFVYGTGDFTIEFWFRSDTSLSNSTLFDQRPFGTDGPFPNIYVFSSNIAYYVNGADRISGTTTLAGGTWYHVAVCRSGTTTKLFVNGTQEGSSYTDTTNYNNGASAPTIGGDSSAPGSFLVSGYFEEIRVTKGVARYTANFTVPGAPFPDSSPSFIGTAVSRPMAMVGATPTVVTTSTVPFNGTPASGSLTIAGQLPLFNPSITNVTGRGFLSQLNVPNASISGRGFSTAPSILYAPDFPTTVLGNGFSTSPEIFGGAVVTGRGFSQAPVITVVPNNEFSVTGRGFSTNLNFSFSASFDGKVSGRGFSTQASIFGGAVVTGRGFSSSLVSTTLTAEHIAVIGRGFSSTLVSKTIAPVSIAITGGGFTSTLARSTVLGQGFSTSATIRFTSTYTYSEAFVMNILNNQVSRYTNYPFSHIVTVADKQYGVAADGLYLLDGTLDGTQEIASSITTKETDFGIFQSKNVPYVYLNGDDTYTVTPIVDGNNKPSVRSAFKGRKAHPGRGNKGRYWAFKIEGIHELQGLEYLPEILQRRVK